MNEGVLTDLAEVAERVDSGRCECELCILPSLAQNEV
jgi:hypothetical protein